MKNLQKRYISLGRNCEVSFQLERLFGKLYSSIFSWAYITDDKKLVYAMKNIDDLMENSFHFHMPTNDMFWDDVYDIVFHAKISKKEYFDDIGNIVNQNKYDEAISELKSRLRHLKEKWKNDLKDDTYLYIYIYKLVLYNDEEWNIREKKEFLHDLDNYFTRNKNGKFELIVVVEEKYYNYFCDEKFEKLKIEKINYFAPDSDTKNGADNIGWERILKNC